jgi:hypothetical protein
MSQATDFFNACWQDYCNFTPQARQIHNKLAEAGENPINDHIALRTFNFPGIELDDIAELFKPLGFQLIDDYQFPDRHLNAKALILNADTPKVFISELNINQLSTANQLIILNQLNKAQPIADSLEFLYSGRTWDLISYQDFKQLAQESEYAAWLMVMGFHANHFTISLNHLTSYSTWPEFLSLIHSLNIPLNKDGGIIKGTPDIYLEQASTLADEIEVNFSDGIHRIKTCFYEFAKRFLDAEGNLYQGFVTNNANQIFSSTDQTE